MNLLATFLLASLSLWDYPARQPHHELLRAEFIQAMRTANTAKMADVCKRGVELLPDDPTWRYNLACALSYNKDNEVALDELEKAIDLGFRDAKAIENDNDLKRLKSNPRFSELVQYARDTAGKPILLGPNAVVPATGVTGSTVTLGEQNMLWDFDLGIFDVKMSLAKATSAPNTFDLYMNRDAGHSRLAVTNWVGLTEVRLDADGRAHHADLDFPNMAFPYPLFGNCSRALTEGPYWRSLPRALMTTDRRRLEAMRKFYLSNQVWVFPAVDDYNFATNKFGDVFSSVTPYCIVTKGRSWTDQFYLKAALEISRSLKSDVKAYIVQRGLLAPVVQMILRMSLRDVKSLDDYFTPKAHPTCFAQSALDMKKLRKFASSLKISDVPPLAAITGVAPVNDASQYSKGEITYAGPFAWAIVLRSDTEKREFAVRLASATSGAGSIPAPTTEFECAVVHDPATAANVRKVTSDTFIVTIDKSRLSPNCRVDIGAFAKSSSSVWGAPSFISFAVVDPSAPYSDPAL